MLDGPTSAGRHPPSMPQDQTKLIHKMTIRLDINGHHHVCPNLEDPLADSILEDAKITLPFYSGHSLLSWFARIFFLPRVHLAVNSNRQFFAHVCISLRNVKGKRQTVFT